MRSKAQTATELIVIFIIIGTAIYTAAQFASLRLGDIRSTQAREAVTILTQAATDIYDAGGGTKTVRITLPTGMNNTVVSNHSIVIRYMSKDTYVDAVGMLPKKDVILIGGIPPKSGEHWIKVGMIENRTIKIGEGHGAVICGQNYFCGLDDEVCPGDYGADCTSEDDPDC
ncbi:MAG: hypothetical protein ACTSPB_19170 [Candidatus Thorarchaeota archaeon]